MKSDSQDDFRNSFFEECEELLEVMHDGFDNLRNNLEDVETIHAIFRAIHSIKGGAGAFKLDALVDFSHEFETRLDFVRSGSASLSIALIALLQRCGDKLTDVVHASKTGHATDTSNLSELLNELDRHINFSAEKEVTLTNVEFEPLAFELDELLEENLTEIQNECEFVQYLFLVERDLFRSGNEVINILLEAINVFDAEVHCDTTEVPALAELDPDECKIAWTLSLPSRNHERAIQEIFEFVEDCCILSRNQEDPEKISEVVELGVEQQKFIDGVQSQKRPKNSSEDQKYVDTNAVVTSVNGESENQNGVLIPRRSETTSPVNQSIRVELSRIDRLINSVGELVIKEAMLAQSIEDLNLENGNRTRQELESLKNLASEIQEGVMAIRAQPIKPIFQRMARTVREAAQSTGKMVCLNTLGDTTEVDKTILERLVDPLNHMVRNAIDHGIESAEARERCGKSVEGNITLSALHRSGRVVIEVTDDGQGINRERVESIARSKELVEDGLQLSDQEIDNLLFLPGFSSKEEISELSGRGVGLDVVKSEIAALGGRVSIESEPGNGTKFSISLPLTLAVLEGIVVQVENETLIIPISAVRETLQPDDKEIHRVGKTRSVLVTRDGVLPIVVLAEHFGAKQNGYSEEENFVLLIVETDSGERCVFKVNKILEQRQVVIKSLEQNFGKVPGIAAATILGNGEIALIVSPDEIIIQNERAARKELRNAIS